jgi:hypothetical protein
MSGRKQHYIPQCVQRAFEANRAGTKCQVFVFRGSGQVYLTSTEGSAAERDFYSIPSIDGASALDDAITDFEGRHLAPILQTLRSAPDGEVDAELASVAVAHLAIRTAHMRRTMGNFMAGALDQFKTLLNDSDALRRFSEVDSSQADSKFAQLVSEVVADIIPSGWPEKDQKFIERIVRFRLREKFDDLIEEAIPTLSDGLRAFEPIVSNTIPNAHARALSNSLIPAERVGALRRLNWHVETSAAADAHFILPDCVVIGRAQSRSEYEPLATFSSSEAATVIMPLTSSRLLIGTVGVTELLIGETNQHLAQCSLDFFISSRDDKGTRALVPLIGACASAMNIQLLDEDDELPKRQQSDDQDAPSALRVRVPIGRVGEKIGRRLTQMATDALDSPSLRCIESIVVPSNVRSALVALWKREPTPNELEAAGFGSVEPLKVGADWKCRVILPRNFVEALADQNRSDLQVVATRMVKFNLGRAYYFSCWARTFPTALDAAIEDPWRGIVARATFRIAACYFGGLASARHGPEPMPWGNPLQELAVILRGGLDGLHEVRKQFFRHRNIDQLVVEALQPVEAMASVLASVLGFHDAKNLQLDPESEAGLVLQTNGLWEWQSVFSKDLSRHYETRHRWQSEDGFFQLGEHIERLLWTVGIVVSPTDQGHWVDVIDDDRLKIIANALRA